MLISKNKLRQQPTEKRIKRLWEKRRRDGKDAPRQWIHVIVLLRVCSFSLTHFLGFAALGKWGHTLFWCVFVSYGRTLNTMQMSTQTKWSHATRQNMELWRRAIEGKRKKEFETDVRWWEEAILIKLQRETDFYNYLTYFEALRVSCLFLYDIKDWYPSCLPYTTHIVKILK